MEIADLLLNHNARSNEEGHVNTEQKKNRDDETTLPFSDQYEIRQSVHNDRPRVLLDHVRQDSEHRRQTIVSVREHVHVRALSPFDVDGCVDRFLDLLTVEINGRLFLREGTPVI